MKPQPLRIAPRSLEPFVGDVRRHGVLGRETGAFFLTSPGKPDVAVVALAGDKGVDRAYGRLVIGLKAIDKAFAYAEQGGLQIRAMLHSHPRAAFMSRTDLRYSLRVRGFVNAIVPTFANPPTDPSCWGWWQYDGGWSTCSPAVTDPACAQATVLVFDADGVRAFHGH